MGGVTPATPSNTSLSCPRCGSAAVHLIDVVEHEPCGAIKPREEFETDDGVCCPNCDSSRGELKPITDRPPVTCADCAFTFSPTRDRGLQTDGDGRQHDPLVHVRARIETATPTWPTWVPQRSVLLVAAVILLLITSTAPLAVGSPDVSGSGPAVTERSWDTYQSIVIFRNDDIQPHYKPQTRRAVDTIFIQETVPVTQGIIPAINNTELNPSGNLCQELRAQSRAHPGLFEYALHGYTHEQRTNFSGGSEFGGIPSQTQLQLIHRGTDVVQNCVGTTPETFIPPLNTYDNATARALAATGFDVVSGGGWFTDEYYNRTGVFEQHGVLQLPSTQSFVKNWRTNELYSLPYLEHQFNVAYQNSEVYVQMLHYSTFSSGDNRDVLRGLITHMKAKPGVAFLTVGEFGHKYRTGTLRRTADGWRLLEPTTTPSTHSGSATNASGLLHSPPHRSAAIGNQRQ